MVNDIARVAYTKFIKSPLSTNTWRQVQHQGLCNPEKKLFYMDLLSIKEWQYKKLTRD